jgi:uncharacterized protein (DUF849 family)
MEGKKIVTAALTGAIHTPTMSPYVPLTPKQIADEAVRCYEAGAAVVHIHTRDPKTGEPNTSMEYYAEILGNIKSRCNLVACVTTGGGIGMTPAERVEPVTRFKPELASFNAGSINFALFHALDKIKEFKFDWEENYLAKTEDYIFRNTFASMKEFTQKFSAQGTLAEFECYDAGMINNLAFMIQRGYPIRKPIYIQFVMGILGGITAEPENLMFLVNYAKRLLGEFEFSVAAAGKAQISTGAQSLLLGGHVRVGLEDNLYLEKGRMAKSSAEQVEKIIRIARELGIEPATPDEARKILSLKGLDKVNF